MSIWVSAPASALGLAFRLSLPPLILAGLDEHAHFRVDVVAMLEQKVQGQIEAAPGERDLVLGPHPQPFELRQHLAILGDPDAEDLPASD